MGKACLGRDLGLNSDNCYIVHLREVFNSASFPPLEIFQLAYLVELQLLLP